MCCTKKWVGGLAALAVVLVALGVLSGTDAGRWVTGTIWVQLTKLWDGVHAQIPPEDELIRIGNEINNLNKDIAVEFDKIVRQEREIEKVEKDALARRKAVEEQWKVITALKAAVEDAKAHDTTFVVFEGKKSDLVVARKELTERWDTFKRAKAGLDQKEVELKEKRDTLAAMNENMNEMVKAKDDYALKVDELKTKLELARTVQARNQTGTVNEAWKTRQTHIQESLDKIGDQIEVMDRLAKEHAKQLKTKNDTGAGQSVRNDITEKEIREYQESMDKLATK